MKKYILFLTAVFLSVNIFAYDRDYSAIQKQQEKEEKYFNFLKRQKFKSLALAREGKINFLLYK